MAETLATPARLPPPGLAAQPTDRGWLSADRPPGPDRGVRSAHRAGRSPQAGPLHPAGSTLGGRTGWAPISSAVMSSAG